MPAGTPARLGTCQSTSKQVEPIVVQHAWLMPQVACAAHAECTGWVWLVQE